MDRIPNMNSTIWSQLFEYRIIRIIRCNSDFFVGPRKTVDGDTCTFPFNFRGVTYNDCTNEQAPWCAVETFENKTVKDWCYCVSQGRIFAF